MPLRAHPRGAPLESQAAECGTGGHPQTGATSVGSRPCYAAPYQGSGTGGRPALSPHPPPPHPSSLGIPWIEAPSSSARAESGPGPSAPSRAPGGQERRATSLTSDSGVHPPQDTPLLAGLRPPPTPCLCLQCPSCRESCRDRPCPPSLPSPPPLPPSPLTHEEAVTGFIFHCHPPGGGVVPFPAQGTPRRPGSAVDLLEQWRHGPEGLHVLDLVPDRAVDAPKLNQQA